MHAESGAGFRSMTCAGSAPRLALVRTAAYRAVSGAWSEPVALASSGGVDSTALVLLASEAHSRAKLAPFVVMHVDHGSRPETASEADFVRALCAARSIPFVPLRLSDTSRVAGRSAEEVWRERRYAVLIDAARRMGLRTIVTAHNRDDQVETILMRLMTGSGRLAMHETAVRGSAAGNVTLRRPLLGTSRAELQEVLDIAGVTACEDPSNLDVRYRRNAVRHEVMPVLQRVFPGFEDALIRSATLRQVDAAFADEQARSTFEKLQIPDDSSDILIDKASLATLPPAIATRVVRLATQRLIAGDDTRELTFERVEAVRNAATGRTGATIELPYGVRVRIERDVIRFGNIRKGG